MLAFAELDAWPEMEDEHPMVLVRPREPFSVGSRIAVVVTSAVKRTDGEAVSVDWSSAEEMRRKDELYRYVVVVGHNDRPVEPAGGWIVRLPKLRWPNGG